MANGSNRPESGYPVIDAYADVFLPGPDVGSPRHVQDSHPPSVGQRRDVFVAERIEPVVGARFWVFYQPPDSLINGLEWRNRTEIDAMAVAELRVESLDRPMLDPTKPLAGPVPLARQIQVEVLDVLMLADAHQRLEPTDSFDVSLWGVSNADVIDHDDWIYYHNLVGQGTGDEWILFRRFGQQLRIIANGASWSVSHDSSFDDMSVRNCEISHGRFAELTGSQLRPPSTNPEGGSWSDG